MISENSKVITSAKTPAPNPGVRVRATAVQKSSADAQSEPCMTE